MLNNDEYYYYQLFRFVEYDEDEDGEEYEDVAYEVQEVLVKNGERFFSPTGIMGSSIEDVKRLVKQMFLDITNDKCQIIDWEDWGGK